MNSLAIATFNIGINRVSDMDGDTIRLVLMIAIPIAIIQFILLITALVGLVKKQVPREDKLIWGLIIVFANILGPILYFAIGSNSLDQKAAALEEIRERQEQERNYNG